MTLKATPNSLGSATTFQHVANLVGWLDKNLVRSTEDYERTQTVVSLPLLKAADTAQS
jgi:hypothetical protein